MPSTQRSAKTKGENDDLLTFVNWIRYPLWQVSLGTFLIIFSLQIYWLKDRVEVQPERDSNYIQAADGHLIIIQAREKDRANYTCVAENVANRRLSPPARLNIHGKSNLLTQFFFTPRLANSIK